MRSGSEERRTLLMGQAPGIHWYHAHKHGSTAINVSNGMTGAFIIEGKYDDDLNRFYGTMDVAAAPGAPNPTQKSSPLYSRHPLNRVLSAQQPKNLRKHCLLQANCSLYQYSR
jgi:hypothetical protein